MVFFETVQPVADRVWWNGESSRFDLTGATNPAARPRPQKERQNSSWCAARVAEIEMIRSRIIEIDRAFHEAKTEKSHIEVQVSLRIAGDRSHMVKSGNLVHQHNVSLGD